jgi:hypothetical protein
MADPRESYALKSLPVLTPGQSWCCDNGCGVTVPSVRQFEYSREEDRHGNLIKSKTAPVWRSACCDTTLFIYDEATGSSTSWED